MEAEPLFVSTPAWRDGDLLVVPAHCRFADRCLRCGDPASTPVRQTIDWHPPIWYALIAAGLLIYVVAALIVRARAELTVGLCERHAVARRRRRGVGWALVAMAFASGAIAIALETVTPGALAPFILLAGIVTLSVAGRVVRIRRIADELAWISNASPRLVAGLVAHPWVRR